MLQLVFPFLSQAIVDVGIGRHDLDFIYIVLIAQLALSIGRASSEFLRNWIILHVGTRINTSMISQFLEKLMGLPLQFFESNTFGEIMQRLNDNHRVEAFLTSSVVGIAFAGMTFLVFSLVLLVYSPGVFLVYGAGSVIHVLWVGGFMAKRRLLDGRRFDASTDSQNAIVQMVAGIQDIKLSNVEVERRWSWETIQAKLLRVRTRSLSLSQLQQAGALLIGETRNIVITVISAREVVEGNMTLGMMLAIQYILGQLGGPVGQIVDFMHSTQDARISSERLGEILAKDSEVSGLAIGARDIRHARGLDIEDLWFSYDGQKANCVLKGVTLQIPANKVTAIVGASGSGKTTLLKLLVGFYSPTHGELRVGDVSLSEMSKKAWRENIGVVMQDGFIFADTIARNVVMLENGVVAPRLVQAAKAANLDTYIKGLPCGFGTRIGHNGAGLSQGQKQRILIARAIYRNPCFLFLDEPTSALDAENERVIMQNLKTFFSGRTVVIIAHKLSTVKDADLIVALGEGRIVELGKHQELLQSRGAYYSLVRDQLALTL